MTGIPTEHVPTEKEQRRYKTAYQIRKSGKTPDYVPLDRALRRAGLK